MREYSLANHIIFILGAPTATVTRAAGLRNFLTPLRASSIRLEDIKTVIFYVSRRFIEREWNTVASFPRVFVFAVCYFSVFVLYYIRQVNGVNGEIYCDALISVSRSVTTVNTQYLDANISKTV